jgi:hypothetical protein
MCAKPSKIKTEFDKNFNFMEEKLNCENCQIFEALINSVKKAKKENFINLKFEEIQKNTQTELLDSSTVN